MLTKGMLLLVLNASSVLQVSVFNATWAPGHSGRDLPIQINLGMLSPPVLQTDLSTWLPIF